jgi:hypothetical protein
MALSAMSCKGVVALFVVFETFDDSFNQQKNKETSEISFRE